MQAFWHFGILAKKSDRKSDPIFQILSRLPDSTALILTHLLARPTDSHLDRGGGELDRQLPRRARLPTDAAADGALGLHGLHRHPALLHRLRRRRRAGDQGQDD